MDSRYVLILFCLLVANSAQGKPTLRPSKGHNRYGRYMIKFKDECDVTDSADRLSRHFRENRMKTGVRHRFERLFHGISVGDMSMDALRWIMTQECVEYVEEAGVITATEELGTTEECGTNYRNWGLDRITEAVYSSSYSYDPKYSGYGTEIFIVDSGVRLTHSDFAGRADYLNMTTDPETFNETNDCFGHGTQISGIAIGTCRGTATQAKVTSVKVLDCNGTGTSDDLLSALERILEERPNGGAIVSLSLTTENNYTYIHGAVVNLINANFVVVAAAGNYNGNACYYYPVGYSRELDVIGVGAINAKGKLAPFSNYGPCVDIYAPGANIYTPTNTGDDQIKKVSGTSFAVPFVDGAAAMLLEKGISPSDVKDVLIFNSTTSVTIQELPHNRILFVQSN